jgi:hypothetical protein
VTADLCRWRTQLRHVLSDMKFIEYPVGGYIAPHVDGVRTDEVRSDYRFLCAPSRLAPSMAISLHTTVARTHMYPYAAKVWDLSIVQGPFSVAPNPS